VSRVGVSGDWHHFRRTGERLHSAVDPVDCDVVDVVFGEDVEDWGVGVTAGSLLGGVRMNGDPQNDVVVEYVLAVFIKGREAHRQHRRDADATTRLLAQSDDLRSNRLFPKLVLEDRVVGGVGGLHRSGGVPLFRDGKRTLHEIGTLEEGRRVVGDAVVEVCALEGRDVVIVTKSEVGCLREKRNLAGRGRAWGWRRTWPVLELGVEAPDLEYSEP